MKYLYNYKTEVTKEQTETCYNLSRYRAVIIKDAKHVEAFQKHFRLI